MRERLDSLDANVLGIVANAIRVGRGDRYGYGYEARQAPPPNGGSPAAPREPKPRIPVH
jgi:hypothetical protein